jgi:ABC-type polar amino acid transport system ATPase subunit
MSLVHPIAPAAATAPLILVEGVNKSFGAAHVVRDVTTTFREGEVAVVIGASGSGKSTFLRMLNRLETHDSGRIVIDGIELNDSTRNLDAIRREVGMVFQAFNLFPHLTALENVALAPRRVRRTPRRASCSPASGSATTRTSTRSSSPAGSNSASRSRARSRCSRR